jgi:hypothetical protein
MTGKHFLLIPMQQMPAESGLKEEKGKLELIFVKKGIIQ